MKTNMVKMALLGVLVMVAIMPNCAFAAATYYMQPQAPATYYMAEQPTVNAQTSYGLGGNYLSNGTQNAQNITVIGGTAGGAFQFILENRLRAMMAKIGVVSNTYMLSGTADLSYADKGFALGQSQGALGVRWHKATASVHLELVTADNGFVADASQTKTLDWNISGIAAGGAGTFGTGRQAAENEFLWQVGNQVLTSLVSQMLTAQKVAQASQPAARISGMVNLVFPSGQPTQINVPATNPVGINDQIWFVNTVNQVTGKYNVLKLNAQTVVLEKVQGFQSLEPQNGDGFAIIYPK
jgi:hypothetical protein